MKKVLILQNKGKSFGGVWQVNKMIGEALIKKGYLVHIVSIRNNRNNLVQEHHKDLVVKTINELDEWESYHLSHIIQELKQFHFMKATKKAIAKIKYNIVMKKDIHKLHQYIEQYNPNYIITSHYQLLDMIPKKYLNRTIHEQHSSFAAAINNPANIKAFYKYNGKIKYLWLTKKTMEEAKKYGITNNTYIYNAVKFTSNKRAEVIKNKKIITIARLSQEKRIAKMVNMVKEVFNDEIFNNWTFEIYGDGELENEIKEQIGTHKQIKLMGLTNNPKEKLLSSSINLNTSSYEGFSLSILEANECGIPTITFDFGESVNEQIINGKTGIIATSDEDYMCKLKELMRNQEKLEELSINAKEFSKNFHLENIIDQWTNLFNEMDQDGNEK